MWQKERERRRGEEEEREGERRLRRKGEKTGRKSNSEHRAGISVGKVHTVQA